MCLLACLPTCLLAGSSNRPFYLFPLRFCTLWVFALSVLFGFGSGHSHACEHAAGADTRILHILGSMLLTRFESLPFIDVWYTGRRGDLAGYHAIPCSALPCCSGTFALAQGIGCEA
ncbi:hypothetical protein GGR54DRAFT_540197 [Hypoxylon sp. NC1633]|nr:hypothetical protein GGR54DRAFT_540197 [Hypoxylon sp. NC1633]